MALFVMFLEWRQVASEFQQLLALQVSDVERSNAYYRWKLAQALRLKNTRCHCAVIIIIIIIIHLI